MSLRKKFAQNIVPVMLTASAAIGGGVGYQMLDYDWDDQRGDSAEQIVTGFEDALEELSDLKQENIQLDTDRKLSLLKWESVSNHGLKYQKNLEELSQRSTEYAKLMLATPDISERDFEGLATQFNNMGLTNFSNIKVNPVDADGLKECQIKHYSANADKEMHNNISQCMDDDKKFGIAPLSGTVGALLSMLLLLLTEDSRTLHKWRNLPDKPKPKKGASGEKLGARLKRHVGLAPKRPQN